MRQGLKTAGFYSMMLVVLPLLVLAVLEGSLRLAGPDDLTLRITDPDLLVDPDPDGFYRNAASFDGRVWNVSATTNAAGFRGPDRRTGTPTVLLLGDSIFFGIGLPDEATPAYVLPELLEGGLQVINTAVIGYGTAHQRALLEREGDRLNPGVVVLGYCLNDPLPMQTASIATTGSLSWMQRVNVVLRKRLLLFLWLKDTAHTYRVQHGYDRLRPLFDESTWARHAEDLRAIAAWCDARDVPLLVAVFPHRDQLIDAVPTDAVPQQRIARIAAGEGFAWVDLRSVITPEDYLAADPYHLDARGMSRALAALAPYIDAATRLNPTHS